MHSQLGRCLLEAARPEAGDARPFFGARIALLRRIGHRSQAIYLAPP